MGKIATSVEAWNKALVRDRFEEWVLARHRTPFELLADDASWTIEGNAVASKMEERE